MFESIEIGNVYRRSVDWSQKLQIMDNIVFLNGKFIDKSKASISIMDRGFFFGDGVMNLSCFRTNILTDKHLARLRSSLNHQH